MQYKMTLTLLALALATGAGAKVRLSHLVGDNMVLQQQTEARLWGWDDAGRKIKVTTSWSKEVYTATAAEDGSFLVKVKTPKASFTPLSVTFDDGEKTTISNLLAGEVWLCGGQSNMEMPMSGFGNCPIDGYNEEMLAAGQYSNVRYCTLPMRRAFTPQEDTECEWRTVSSQTLGDLSATAWYFAKSLSRALDIPIGLVVAMKGGSKVEGWLNEANLKKYTSYPTDEAGIRKCNKNNWSWPMVWCYGTFHPVRHCTVNGIIWYQGCSNVGSNAKYYAERLGVMARQWREDLGLGDIPFYIVQIAPYKSDGGNGDGTSVPRFWEQQLLASRQIPNSGIVSTQDQVHPWEGRQIHPAKKDAVGQRLAYQALSKTYGHKEYLCESPKYKSMQISHDTCYVTLTDVYKGISSFDALTGFEVAGSDRVFHKAEAKAKGKDMVVVTCAEVKEPVAVRYNFHNWTFGNVRNSALLPLIAFRTDDWEQ